ncbi:MAG: two-component sensor histidine kinase [Variovorax sp.]|nr:two-component sensor histidine kinase [Variovorax sp.]
MDGRPGEIGRSLQFRLSAWLSSAILAVAVAAGVLSFAGAYGEAIEMQDDQLRQIAALLQRQQLPGAPAARRVEGVVADPESRVVVQRLAAPGAPELGGELPGLPANLPDGLQTVELDQRTWRVFVRTLAPGSRIAVGQRTAVRDEIARDSALRTLTPLLVLIPILLLLVADLVRKMFRPLKGMASELDRRAEDNLREVAVAHVPPEIRPFVVAINRLLSRVGESVALQRRFVADAAHELRSPLTALSLQAERLEATDLPPEARQRLAALQGGIQRTRSLLEQLLALARAQAPSREPVVATASVQRAFRQVLEALMPLAEAKHIDVGVVGQDDAEVRIGATELKTLLGNLVENAIRHTPEGGRIDLCVRPAADHAVLRVDDTGPGIAPEERARVFDPFYRVLGNDAAGSGLGLSIVRTIADRAGAQVSLGYRDEHAQAGLRVTVTLPLAQDRPRGPAA